MLSFQLYQFKCYFLNFKNLQSLSRKDARQLSLLSVCVCAQLLSCVRLFFFILAGQPARSSVHGFFQMRILERQHHILLQGIVLPLGTSPCLLHLLHWQADSLPLSHLGSPFNSHNCQKERKEYSPFQAIVMSALVRTAISTPHNIHPYQYQRQTCLAPNFG